MELEQSGFGVQHMEIAHGLLNIHERWGVMRSLAKPMREARARNGQKPDATRLLDSILGG
jgi:hypothetical protein